MSEQPELRVLRKYQPDVCFRVNYLDGDGSGIWWELYWNRKCSWDTYEDALEAVTQCMSASPGTPGKRNIAEFEIARQTEVMEVVTR